MRSPLRAIARRIPTIERTVLALAAIVTIAGFPFAISQLMDLRDQRENRSIQVVMLVDQQLMAGANVGIRHAIERGKPVLERNGGQFTDEQLSDYLDAYEGLADAYALRLVDLESIYIWHSYYILKLYRNKEVAEYIARVRDEEDPQTHRKDTEFYTGLEDLAKELLDEEKRRQTPPVPTLGKPRMPK